MGKESSSQHHNKTGSRANSASYPVDTEGGQSSRSLKLTRMSPRYVETETTSAVLPTFGISQREYNELRCKSVN
jgi:hypothetical protein